VGYNVFAADNVGEAHFLASSMQQAFVALRTGATGSGFRPPVAGYYESLADPVRTMLDDTMKFAAIGTPRRGGRAPGSADQADRGG
jgi:hypothetical protein